MSRGLGFTCESPRTKKAGVQRAQKKKKKQPRQKSVRFVSPSGTVFGGKNGRFQNACCTQFWRKNGGTKAQLNHNTF